MFLQMDNSRKRYRCDVDGCSAAYSQKGRLNYHNRKVHKGELLKVHKCTYCDKTFDRRFSKSRHERSFHLHDKKYPCDKCDGAFLTAWELRRHIDGVHGKTKRICECGTAFSRNDNLMVHKALCAKEIPRVRCETCNKTFKSIRYMKAHIKFIHGNKKTYICETCGISYHHRGSLWKHKKKHQ